MRLFDLHCDTLYECAKKKIDLAVNRLQLSVDRGLSVFDDWVQTFAIWIPDELRGQAALEHFKYCYEYFVVQIDKYSDIIVQCKAQEDFIKYPAKCKAVLSVEGGAVLAGDIKNLDLMNGCGVKMITLTWNDQNELASGAFSEKDNGLSDFGKQAVKRMYELSILPDVSHLSDKAFYDVCSLSNKPFIATHSNLRSICQNPRNLTDDMFKQIAQRKGIVGINLYTAFVNGKEDYLLDELKQHIDKAIALGGCDALCIGTDFDGADMPTCLNKVEKMNQLHDYLLQNGMDKQLVDKIFYKNAYDFFIKAM